VTPGPSKKQSRLGCRARWLCNAFFGKSVAHARMTLPDATCWLAVTLSGNSVRAFADFAVYPRPLPVTELGQAQPAASWAALPAR